MDVSVPTRELTGDDRPRIGEMFAGRYRIESKLGEGGFGAVYAARDRQLERDVAIKVLDHAGDATVLARFLQEAKTIASLDSEHVVTLHEVAVAGRAPYLVMERLRGSDLGVVLHEHRALPIETAVDHVLEAALGVAHAHGRGIVHRDLKPRNLFLAERTDGTKLVKVLDFGVAKAQTSELTESGTAIGTTRFMAPEQLRSSRSVDARTDIWALGAVLYELISGKPIFDGGSAAEIGVAILTDPHVPLRDRAAEVDTTLAAAVDRCLEKNPDARFADVGELARALGADDTLLARFDRALHPDRPRGEATREMPSTDRARLGTATTRATPEIAGDLDQPTRSLGSRWLVIGSLLLAVGGIAFGLAMAMRAPVVERIVVAADAPLRAVAPDAALATAPDAGIATAPDAAVAPPADAAVVAIVRDTRPRQPKPKVVTDEEVALIAKVCNASRSSAPSFLKPGESGGAYGCRQLGLLGCAGIKAECTKYAVTYEERMTCRDFILKIRAEGCPP